MLLDSLLVATRLLLFVSILVLFGASLFLLYGIGSNVIGGAGLGAPRSRWTWPRQLLLTVAAAALLASTGWLVVETASVTGNPVLPIDWAGLHIVAADTRFGAIAFGRTALLAVAVAVILAVPASRWLWGIQAALGGAAVASFAWTGHGTLGEGVGRLLHAGSDVLHLLAAGIWVGALTLLAILIRRSFRTHAPVPAHQVAASLERFSGVGPAVVAVLVLTGIVNSAYLIGASRWRELFTTMYGRVLILKLALFGAMLVLAAFNRYRLSPRLRIALQAPAPAGTAVQALRRSVLLETGLALAVLAAVALLGILEPPVSGSP